MPNQMKRAVNQQHILNIMLNHDMGINPSIRVLLAASLMEHNFSFMGS